MKTIDFKTGLGLVVIVGSLLAWKSALALRCGTDIIEDNAPLYQVQQECQNGVTYQVQNENADIVKYYYKQGGMTHEMTFVDGELQSIKSNR